MPDREARLERLLAAGRKLTSELDLSTVLEQILQTARELTGAQYAAIGILDEQRRELAQFLTAGIDEEARRAIGDLPRGHGILGLLIERPEALRLHDVSQHPRSFGFPLGHPPMRSFLGAPILIRGEAWGNLYLTEKAAAEDFDDDDVETIVILAEWAAVAVDNARLFGEDKARRAELERSLRTARTAMDIATAIGGDTDLPHILELIVKRARALVEADSLLIWLRSGDRLEIAASAGNAAVPPGTSIPLGSSTSGEVLRSGRAMLVDDVDRLVVSPAAFGMSNVRSALLVPLMHRGQGHGVLAAFDRMGSDRGFDREDERALTAFAASAATAVATGRAVERQRLHDAMAAAESERRRWARELHDETLQDLASIKIALSAALRGDPAGVPGILESVIAQLDLDIKGLRAIITDLRPAALDELGLEPALRTLVTRTAEAGQLETEVSVDLNGARLDPTVETVAYRIAQEALTNVLKHAHASKVTVDVGRRDGRIVLTVADDGRGSEALESDGFGVAGMRERALLAGGELVLTSSPGAGTTVTLSIPVA